MTRTGSSGLTPRSVAGTESVRNAGDVQSQKIELLQSILDSLSDGIVACDKQGRFTYFNPAGAAILGKGATNGPMENWSRDYGLFASDGTTPFPIDQLPLVRAVRGEFVRDVEVYVRHESLPDGRWLKVTASPTRNDAGTITGAVALFRDESATKRAEQALESERRYLRYLIEVQDRDRRLTAYDMHDGVVQTMTGALLRLEAHVGKHATSDASPNSDDLTASARLMRDALDEARRLIGGLRPPVIDELGVIGAIQFLVENCRKHDALHVDFEHDGTVPRLPPIVESTIFRIVQEALTNVARHAHTDRAVVRLSHQDGRLLLDIRDQGVGFELSDRKQNRYGLRGIVERAQLLGGTARVESRPDCGTSIQVCLPTNPTSPNGPKDNDD